MRSIDLFMLIGWPIVHIVVGGLLMTLIMSLIRAWFLGGRDRALPAGQGHRLVHPAATLIFGLLVAAACSTFARGLFRAGETFAGVFFSFFASIGLLLIAEYICARHELFDHGIRYGGLLTCRRSLRWVEVAKVSYATGMKWFKLETQAGETVRISAELRGLPQFATALLAQVAPEAIDAPTRTILEATAAGSPPDLFQT